MTDLSVEYAKAVAPAARSGSSGKKKHFTRLTVSITILAYGYAAYVFFGPSDPLLLDHGYVQWWYIAFLARTFDCHAGLALLAVIGVALARRRVLFALALLPPMLFALGPTMLLYLPSSARGADADTIRVMSVNLLWTNRQYEPLIAEIQSADPDVLLIQEYTESWQRELTAALGDAYAFVLHDPGEAAFGSAVYSKFPFAEPPRTDAAYGLGLLSAPRVLVDAMGRPVTIYNVHVVPPTGSNLTMMRRQIAALLAELSESDEVVIFAGDFNATGRSALHRTLLSHGLTDAHESAGFGLGGTWPNRGLFSVFPGVRIDHVYLGRGLAASHCQVGRGAGSDHRPLIVDVRLDRD